jgi:hypothetical protein
MDYVDGVRLTSQNRGHQLAYFSSPGLYVSVESHGGDASLGKLLTLPPELSGNPTIRDLWERVGGMDGGVRFLPVQYLKYLKGFLTSRNDSGPPALLSIRRKVCSGFLSPSKIHRPGRV